MVFVLLKIFTKQVLTPSTSDDFVINVSDVHDIENFIIEIVNKYSSQDIKGNIGPAILNDTFDFFRN